MDTSTVLEIVKIVAYVILGAFALYFKANEVLNKKVNNIIGEAESEFEDCTSAGGAKFEWAVDKLYSVVPTALKVFVTRDMVSNVVQKTFNAMEEYATKQIDKAVDKVLDSVPEIPSVHGENEVKIEDKSVDTEN